MAAIIDFSGDISSELNEIDQLRASVETAISGIESELNNLTNYWRDDQSGTFFSTQSSNLTDLKTENTKVQANCDMYLDAIKKELQIYNS